MLPSEPIHHNARCTRHHQRTEFLHTSILTISYHYSVLCASYSRNCHCIKWVRPESALLQRAVLLVQTTIYLHHSLKQNTIIQTLQPTLIRGTICSNYIATLRCSIVYHDRLTCSRSIRCSHGEGVICVALFLFWINPDFIYIRSENWLSFIFSSHTTPLSLLYKSVRSFSVFFYMVAHATTLISLLCH